MVFEMSSMYYTKGVARNICNRNSHDCCVIKIIFDYRNLVLVKNYMCMYRQNLMYVKETILANERFIQ